MLFTSLTVGPNRVVEVHTTAASFPGLTNAEDRERTIFCFALVVCDDGCDHGARLWHSLSLVVSVRFH